ncbi:hypothetical protein ANABIO32_00150 [Rossellomorea marisflavi]|uniref:hypothetical protein n=1 Tax=Rossellomorea marisflavi TaxID=189381 RepID=UPI0025C881C1|nr:hypothetical protein [Rossellomorea marisflavi]GLI82329.1 hypothetical protein ANABIO32_00150 [Rossellomorea marisflavi]
MDTQLKKQCIHCLQLKEKKRNFYKSYSNWHGDGLLPYCKTCLKSYLKDKENNTTAVKEILRILDKPYKEEMWNKAKEMENDTLGVYLKNIALNDSSETYDSSDHLINNVVNTHGVSVSSPEKTVTHQDTYVQEDKVYSKSWLGYYTPTEIEYLEDYYIGLDRDFRIVTKSHKDYAKKIAKASLHMDKCFQEMQDGVNGADKKYKEAKDIFDTLSKSAKFSESQRGITDVGMGSISQIVEMVESETWVYEHKNDLDQDNYDRLIEDFKHIYKSL